MLKSKGLPVSYPIITPENAPELVTVQLIGRGQAIRAAYSPDGKRLAVATSIGVWLYETEHPDGEPRLLDGHVGRVNSIAFSPDGTRLVSASQDTTTLVWAVKSGAIRHRLIGHTAPVLSAAFSPDGGEIITAALDGYVIIWDAHRGDVIHTLHRHEVASQMGMVYHMATSARYSPDGRTIASASIGDVYLWDRATYTTRHILAGLRGSVRLAFAPDSRTLLGVGEGRVQLWDVETGAAIHTFDQNYPEDAAFDPAGNTVLVCTSAGTLDLYSPTRGDFITQIGGHDHWTRVRVSPDGSTILAVAPYGVKVWHTALHHIAHGLQGFWSAITAGAFTQRVQIAFGTADGHVLIWHGHSVAVGSYIYAADRYIGQINIAPNGHPEIADVVVIDTTATDFATLWAAFTAHPHVSNAALTADGAWLAVSNRDNSIDVWQVAAGRRAMTVHVQGKRVMALACHPYAGLFLAAGDDEGTLHVWDVSTGEECALLHAHTAAINQISFHHDGTRLLTASADGTLRVWAVASIE